MSDNVSSTASDNLRMLKQTQKIIKSNIFMLFFKRLFDIIIGIIGTLFLIPLSIVIFIIKKVNHDKTPLFYQQKRIGKNGKYFNIIKYNSMVENADALLEYYLEKNADYREEFNKYSKIKKDPRVTKVGKLIRDTSIDEFPQFINVLIGSMSFIGPRPIIDSEIKRYGEDKEKFLSVKPGITGYWQANGGNKVTYDERMKMELYYVENLSLWLDVKIFFKTIKMLLLKK